MLMLWPKESVNRLYYRDFDIAPFAKPKIERENPACRASQPTTSVITIKNQT